MARKKGQGSRVIAGGILLLLIVGLAGLGARNFGGRVQSIGKVGDTEIDINRYARALSDELRNLSSRAGQNITLSQAQQFGVDRAVLQRIVASTAMENETARVGLSIGDAEVQKQLLATQGFQGSGGTFDRTAYEFALQRNGLTPTEYEATLRAQAAGNILQSAVVSGIVAPKTYDDVMVNFLGERRNFSWIKLDASTLTTPLPDATEEALKAYFDANGDAFMLPAFKKITYVSLSPDDVLGQVQIEDKAIRALYDERSDQYNTPERRLIERLVFATTEDAQAALDAITSGGSTFEKQVAKRGLTLADIDLGDVAASDLGPEADAVFALSQPGIVGPVETDLGPALIRLNAIIAPKLTPFADVRATLRDELAADAARRMVADQINSLDDLLAGGATLEEMAKETDMKLAQIDWIDGMTDGIAADEKFAAEARQVTAEDFPQINDLSDGGVFALRLDELVPARPDTFENARDKVLAAYNAAELAKALQADADAILAKLDGGATLSSLGYAVTVQTHAVRSTQIDGVPADVLAKVFSLDKGKAVAVPGDASLMIAQLADILPPDPNDPDGAAMRSAIQNEAVQGIGQDALAAFTSAVEQQAGITLNQSAINAVHAQFP
jgi:peptidyl-prolyl cis-trans isomerase D